MKLFGSSVERREALFHSSSPNFLLPPDPKHLLGAGASRKPAVNPLSQCTVRVSLTTEEGAGPIDVKIVALLYVNLQSDDMILRVIFKCGQFQ